MLAVRTPGAPPTARVAAAGGPAFPFGSGQTPEALAAGAPDELRALLNSRTPTWLGSKNSPFWYGGTVIEQWLKEIYSAVQNDSRRLAVMGIRSLLETVMIEKVGDSGSIGTNVKNFIAEGYIAQKNEETFRLQVEAGHAGMHRNYVPTKEELDVLLNITESLIETVYVNPHQAKTLKEIPPRKGK